MEICAIVNALIPPVEFPASLLIRRSEWSEVMAAVRRGVPHFIRHAATAELLAVDRLPGRSRSAADGRADRAAQDAAGIPLFGRMRGARGQKLCGIFCLDKAGGCHKNVPHNIRDIALGA